MVLVGVERQIKRETLRRGIMFSQYTKYWLYQIPKQNTRLLDDDIYSSSEGDFDTSSAVLKDARIFVPPVPTFATASADFLFFHLGEGQ